MHQNIISQIIRKFLVGRFSSETEERVQKWIIKDRNTEEKVQGSLEYWNNLESIADTDTYRALKRVNKRTGYTQSQTKKISLFSKVSRVAAILIPLFILAGGYTYYHLTSQTFVEVSVAYGEEKYLFLPDSTEVWLNAGSTIRYINKFNGKQRNVYLDGEAYFSVIRNESKPFIVETGHLSVKVLGTKFNVKAYPEDGKTVTTLTSGKVEVNTGTSGSRILNPNEQLTYNNTTFVIDIAEVSPDESNGWITGQLLFNGASFDEIIKTLERRFDVSIQNHTTISSSKTYTIKFIQDETPEQILNVLEDVVGFVYKKEGDQFILDKKNGIAYE